MSRLAFRSSFRFAWRWTVSCAGIFGSILYITAWAFGEPIPLGFTFGFTFAAGMVFAIVIALYPVYVEESGIRCYDFWGIYHQFEWAQITQVREVGLLGFRYVVASNSSGRPAVWIPLFLSNMPGFVRVVRCCAGEEHPLAKAIRRFE